MSYRTSINLLHVLQRMKGQSIFFDPLHGNNGDDLISMGAREAIKQHQLIETDSKRAADNIVVTGGAGLSSVWGGAYEEVITYCEGELAKKNLLILPSTLTFDRFNFAEKLNSRSGNSVIFARENLSLKRIESQCFNERISYGIDHDMAFWLQDSDFLKQLKPISAEKHILVVERRDAESLSIEKDRALPAPSFLKGLVPKPIKQTLKRRLHEQHRAQSPFAAWSRNAVDEFFPQQTEKPFRFIDVSLRSVASFPMFCKLINEAAVVITTRLHVGILASLLNKKTVVVPGCAKYGKIQGIFNHSLKDFPNTVMADNTYDEI